MIPRYSTSYLTLHLLNVVKLFIFPKRLSLIICYCNKLINRSYKLMFCFLFLHILEVSTMVSAPVDEHFSQPFSLQKLKRFFVQKNLFNNLSYKNLLLKWHRFWTLKLFIQQSVTEVCPTGSEMETSCLCGTKIIVVAYMKVSAPPGPLCGEFTQVFVEIIVFEPAPVINCCRVCSDIWYSYNRI